MSGVAVIGTGGWARVHLDALSQSENLERVVVAGRNRGALDKLAADFDVVQHTTTDLADVWGDDAIDIVNVVVPHHLHAETTIAALKSGKHVICEKPGAVDLDGFDRMVTTARQSERRLLIVMNQLYNPVNQQIRQLVTDGTLGRVFLLAETRFGRHDKDYRNPDSWRTRQATAGGGVLIDGGYHMIYKHLYWLGDSGRPQWVSADAAQLAVDPDGRPLPEIGEDYVCYSVGFDVPLRIASSHAWTLAQDPTCPHQCVLAGTSATLEISDSPTDPLRLSSPAGPHELELPATATRMGAMHACLLDYVSSLQENREPQFGSLALARQTLRIVTAVYESARTGQRVSLD